jgi:hypothetical protein
MTITTKEAERFARWCDTDGFTERATALRSLAAERDALQAENARLREALARAKDLFLQDEPQKAFIEVCAALGEKK